MAGALSGENSPFIHTGYRPKKRGNHNRGKIHALIFWKTEKFGGVIRNMSHSLTTPCQSLFIHVGGGITAAKRILSDNRRVFFGAGLMTKWCGSASTKDEQPGVWVLPPSAMNRANEWRCSWRPDDGEGEREQHQQTQAAIFFFLSPSPFLGFQTEVFSVGYKAGCRFEQRHVGETES